MNDIIPVGSFRIDPSWEFVVRPHPASESGIGSGGQFLCRFPNGYGVSIVRFVMMFGAGSYGAEQGLFELAVLVYHGDGIDDFSLTYDTPITDDVIGHLTVSEAANIMERVAALPQVVAVLSGGES